MRKRNSFDDEIVYLDESGALSQNNPRGRTKGTSQRSPSNPNGRLWVKILLTIVILYVAFLIIGVISTEYYTDEEGKEIPIKSDIQTLEDRDDYDTLTEYISKAREIMRDITIIDIKLLNGAINYGQASVQYENILNKQIEIIIPQLKTENIQIRNEHIRQNLQVIFSNDMALYLQLVIKGLNEQDMKSINDAAAWKTSMTQTYGDIERDIKELAHTLHRENSNFFEWKLEQAVSDKDPSAVINSDTTSSESSENS